jgi:hypothetical protein
MEFSSKWKWAWFFRALSLSVLLRKLADELARRKADPVLV